MLRYPLLHYKLLVSRHTCITTALLVLIIIFVSNNVLTNFCDVIPPLANFDHKGIHMQCKWKQTSRHNCANNSKGRVIWCYNQANWDRAMSLIDGFDWSSLLSNDVNESWTKWLNFLTIMHECIPTQILPKRKNLSWLSKGLAS